LPDFTFTGKYVLEDIRRLELMEMGAGHTPNDLVVYLPDDKILFGADLITNQFHAYMPDGDPDGWLSILEKLGSLEVQAVIPGHGIPGDKSLIGITARYISENLNYAKGLPKEMKFTPDDLDKIEVPLQYRDWWLDQFFTDNIRFLHQKINR
jgi:glyoxylase-like metal-dependent hydrolase (beta-lactamase superfamily II)